VFCVAAVVVTAVRRSSFGMRLLALKDSEAAFATLGLDRQRTVLAVFALSAAMAGVGGGLYASALQSAPPARFTFFTGLSLLLAMSVAGIRTPAAAVVAALYVGTPLFTGLVPEVAMLSMLVIGNLAITLGNHPDGVLPMISSWWSDLTQRRGQHTIDVAVPPGLRAAPELMALTGFDGDDVNAIDRELDLAGAMGQGVPGVRGNGAVGR
jgi:branched-chain amino acid transport system permease protein